jgi:hypothetical protein
MYTNRTLYGVIVSALLTGGIAATGLVSAGSSYADTGITPVVWLMDDPNDPPPPPEPPPPPPPPRQCWALFLPAPCPPPR